MLPGPTGLTKPLILLVWFIFSALLFAASLTGKLSNQKAIAYSLLVLAIYFVWSSGLYRFFLFGSTPGVNIATKVKGFLIRFASSFWYLSVFVPLFFIDSASRHEKSIYMLLISLASLTAAYNLYRRIRLIEDTASTQLSSAAQGYAELEGTVKLYDGEVTRGPDREMPTMLWYSKHLFSSSTGFLLEDEKGRCTIDPRDAEVITPRYTYNSQTYDAIYPNEKIYVLGYLETLKKHRTEYERNALISKKISEWKQNRFNFLDMFDSNHDGKIDDTEMDQARDTAHKHVDRHLEEVYQQPATHVISKPADGRPFILSSVHPELLIKRYRIAQYIHLAAWAYLSILVLAMQANF